jgi:hypothetical protein
MKGTTINAEPAGHAWFDRLTMSALILSLSMDADAARSAVDVVAQRRHGD